MTGWEPDDCHEKIQVDRNADRVCAQAGRDWYCGRGGVSQVRDQRSYFLQLEKEVWRVGPGGVTPPAAVGGRERAVEADRGGPDAGQTDAAGRVKKKALRVRQRRQLASLLLTEYRVSERRACATVFLHRSVYRYVGHPRDDRAVRQRLKEIAETRVRYGFERIQVLLRREGWRDNHKRTYRIYKEEGLNLRSKRPRRNKTAAHRQQRPLLTGPHQCWSMDFVRDQLFDGRRFRALTLVDNYSRECLEIEVGQNLKGIDVVAVMERIKELRGVVPQRIQCDKRERIHL
jgi:hypothetical protein